MENKDVGSTAYSQSRSSLNGDQAKDKDGVKRDPPPVFIMPDGQSYLHVNRNGLIFGCATDRNISPCAVIEVRDEQASVGSTKKT